VKPDARGPLTAEDLGRCPFCFGKLAAAAEPAAVIHSLPMCERFKALEPAAFLRAVRKARELN
jgi:hypothetical protein